MGKTKKKAELDTGVIKHILIMLVILIILLFFVGKIALFSYETAINANCKESVKLNAKRLVVMGTDLTDVYGSTAQINCVTQYITVSETDEKKIMQKIADAMALAWDNFGKGELEIFATEDNTYCMITHVLDFKKSGKLEGFSEYLLTEEIMTNKGTMKYYDFFAGKSYSDGVLSDFKSEYLKDIDVINLDKRYAVIFVMNKDAHLGKLASGLWVGHNIGFLFGLGAGTVAHASGGQTVAAISEDARRNILLEVYTSELGDPDDPRPTRGGTYSTAKADKLAELRKISQPVKSARFVSVVRVGSKVISSLGNYAIVFAGVGTTAGFMLGSDQSSDYDARILLWDYDDLANLDCTYLEGKSGYVEPVLASELGKKS